MAAGIPPLTVEILKEKTGITNEQLNQTIDRQSLWDLAEHFGNWEISIHGLQLTEGEISDVRECAYRHSSNRMAMYEALKIWLQKNPFKTYRSLVEIRLKFHEGSVAVDICGTIMRLATEIRPSWNPTATMPSDIPAMSTQDPSDEPASLSSARDLEVHQGLHSGKSTSPISSTSSSGIDIHSLDNTFVKLTCGCGKCSILDYIGGNSLCSSSSAPPQITVMTPDPPIHKDQIEPTLLPYSMFKTALLEETQKVHHKFCTYLFETFEQLESEAKFNKVKGYCESILTPQVYHPPMYVTSAPSEESLSLVENFTALKTFLQRNYCSWFNYSLISELRKKFLFPKPIEDDQLQEYERVIKQYVQRRCFVHLDDLGPQPQLDTVNVVCKIDVEFNTITAEYIDKLKLLFVKSLKLHSPYCLTLKCIREGCTELVFCAPGNFQAIPALAPSQVALLKKNKFIEVTVGNRQLLTEGNSEPIVELLSGPLESIDDQIQEFKERFQVLKECLWQELNAQNVFSLATILNTHIGLTDVPLDKASVSTLLDCYLSFVDLRLLECIINLFGSVSLKENMDQYGKDMKQFQMKISLSVIPTCMEHINSLSPPTGFVKLEIKANLDLATKTIDDLINFNEHIFQELCVSTKDMLLYSIAGNATIWLLPSSKIARLEVFLKSKNPSFFLKLDILKFVIHGTVVYPATVKKALPVSHYAKKLVMETYSTSSSTPGGVDFVSSDGTQLAHTKGDKIRKIDSAVKSELSDFKTFWPASKSTHVKRAIRYSKSSDAVSCESVPEKYLTVTKVERATRIMKSTPNSQGLAIIVQLSTVHRRMAQGEVPPTESFSVFKDMFNQLQFAVYCEPLVKTLKELADIVRALSQLVYYPKYSDHPIVIVVIGPLMLEDNQMLCGNDKIDITRDIIEPMLPESSPQLADNPKIFFINSTHQHTFASSSRIPSTGNFLISWCSSKIIIKVNKQLMSSHGSIQDILANIQHQFIGQPAPIASVSRLKKPVYLNPLGTADPSVQVITRLGNSAATVKPVHLEHYMTDENTSHDLLSYVGAGIKMSSQSTRSQLKSGYHSFAFIFHTSSESFAIREVNVSLSKTLAALKFAVNKSGGVTKKRIAETLSTVVRGLQLDDDRPIVVAVTGAVRKHRDFTRLITDDGSISISCGIIRPFLCKRLEHVPKLFLINTSSRLAPLVTSKLERNVPSKGNYILSYINMLPDSSTVASISRILKEELMISSDIHSVLENISKKLIPTSSMTVVSRLRKPFHLKPAEGQLESSNAPSHRRLKFQDVSTKLVKTHDASLDEPPVRLPPLPIERLSYSSLLDAESVHLGDPLSAYYTWEKQHINKYPQHSSVTLPPSLSLSTERAQSLYPRVKSQVPTIPTGISTEDRKLPDQTFMALTNATLSPLSRELHASGVKYFDLMHLDIYQQCLSAGTYHEVHLAYWSREHRVEKVVAKFPQTELYHVDLVAVKTRIKAMATIDHPKVVHLLGISQVQQFPGPLPVMISEYIGGGSLRQFLRENLRSLHCTEVLVHFGKQIAYGMEYLEEKGIVHGDLAARNVLLVEYTMQVKISDITLSTVLSMDHAFQASSDELPIYWYAPECLRSLQFTTKNDVWSYGVTLWEIFTLGELPTQYLSEVVQASVPISAQQKLQKLADHLEVTTNRLPMSTDACPSDVYQLIQNCWQTNPSNRPTFDSMSTVMELSECSWCQILEPNTDCSTK